MSYHIVSIDSPQCSISCHDGQLTCKTADGEKQDPQARCRGRGRCRSCASQGNRTFQMLAGQGRVTVDQRGDRKHIALVRGVDFAVVRRRPPERGVHGVRVTA